MTRSHRATPWVLAWTLGACAPQGPRPQFAVGSLALLPSWDVEVNLSEPPTYDLQGLPLRGVSRVQGSLESRGIVLNLAEGQAQGALWRFSFPSPPDAAPLQLRLKLWRDGDLTPSREALGEVLKSEGGAKVEALAWRELLDPKRIGLTEPLLVQTFPDLPGVPNLTGVANFFPSHDRDRLGLVRFNPGSSANVDQLAWLRLKGREEVLLEPFFTAVQGFADGPLGMAKGNGFRDALELSPGRVLVVDQRNHALRLASLGPSGWRIDTVLGNGKAGKVDGLGAEARLNNPVALERGATDSCYLADGGNRRICEVVEEAPGRWRLRTLTGGAPTTTMLDGVGAEASHVGIKDLVWHQGKLWTSEVGGAEERIRRLGPGLTVTTLARWPNQTVPNFRQFQSQGAQLMAMRPGGIEALTWTGQNLLREAKFGLGLTAKVQGQQQAPSLVNLQSLSPLWGGRHWMGSPGENFWAWRPEDNVAQPFGGVSGGGIQPEAGGGGSLGSSWPSWGEVSGQHSTNAPGRVIPFEDGCTLVHWSGSAADLVASDGSRHAFPLAMSSPNDLSFMLHKFGENGLLAGKSVSSSCWVSHGHHTGFLWRQISSGTADAFQSSGYLDDQRTAFSGLFVKDVSNWSWDPVRNRMLSVNVNLPQLFAVNFGLERPRFELWAGALGHWGPMALAEGPASASALNATTVDVSPEGVVWSMPSQMALWTTRWGSEGWHSQVEASPDASDLLDGRAGIPRQLLAFSKEKLVILTRLPPGMYLAKRDEAGNFRLRDLLPSRSREVTEGWGGGLGADGITSMYKRGERLFAVTSPLRGTVVEIKGWDALP